MFFMVHPGVNGGPRLFCTQEHFGPELWCYAAKLMTDGSPASKICKEQSLCCLVALGYRPSSIGFSNTCILKPIIFNGLHSAKIFCPCTALHFCVHNTHLIHKGSLPFFWKGISLQDSFSLGVLPNFIKMSICV